MAVTAPAESVLSWETSRICDNKAEDGNTMKIGIFTDSHYSTAELTCGNRYNSRSLAKIKQALQSFSEEKCDLVVCLGDLIDQEADHSLEVANLRKVSEVFSGCSIPICVLMGNHDAFAFDVEEFYNVLGVQYRPQNVRGHADNLLFLDTCYFKSGKHYQPGDWDWTDTFLPNAEELEELLGELPADACIFMHQNIDPSIPENHRLFNDAQVREIFERSKKVKMVLQGHYHPGMRSEHNGISYITYPAMCENEKAYYLLELS